jgi:hypothetical protein
MLEHVETDDRVEPPAFQRAVLIREVEPRDFDVWIGGKAGTQLSKVFVTGIGEDESLRTDQEGG